MSSPNYTPTTWVDVPDGTTPPVGTPTVSAENLNHLEQGVAEVDEAAVAALAVEVVRAEAAEGANAQAIAANVTAIAAKYTKPGSGIPASDLASAVQTLLTAAGSAVQPGRLVAGHPLSADVTLAAGDVGLGNVNNTSDANKPLSTAATAALAAKADLVGGKIPSGQLPAFSIDHGAITVANATARYALVIGSTVEPGQPVVQASTGQTFILADGATDASQSGQWVEIPAIGKVQSVNGYTGAVTLAASDVGAATTAAVTAAQATANAAKPKLGAPVAKSAAFTAAAATPYLVDISGGSYAATLPSASAAGVGAEVVFKVGAAAANGLGGNTLTITPAGSDTINGGTTGLPLRLVDQAKILVSDGVSNWVPLSGDLSLAALVTYFGSALSGVFASVVQHGSTAGTARPSGAAQVLWIGTVAPTNAAANDRWLNLSTSPIGESVYTGSAWQTLGGSGSGAAIDDTKASATTVYSSLKTLPGAVRSKTRHVLFASQTPAPVLTYPGFGMADGLGCYWPQCIYVADKISNPINGASYYLICSTNHSPSKGGIYLATANSPLGPWTPYVGAAGNNSVFQSAKVGTPLASNQVETPRAVWDPESQQFYVYMQAKGLNGNQGTFLAVTGDFLTWEEILVDGSYSLFKGGAPQWPGNSHNGYATVHRFGRYQWVASHLKGGGGYGKSVMSYSNDGVEWTDDPYSHMNPNVDQQGDFSRHVVLRANYFKVDGELWSVSAMDPLISGANYQNVVPMAGPVSADLSRHTRTPQVCFEPGYAWEGNLDGGFSVFTDPLSGNFYLFYVAGGTAGPASGVGIALGSVIDMEAQL